MTRVGHPSVRKLLRWVQGEDQAVERHLTNCTYCADRLEAALGDSDSDETIRVALLQLLEVPEQLPDRLRSGIEQRLANQRDMMLVAEFFGLPLRTARVITSNDQRDV